MKSDFDSKLERLFHAARALNPGEERQRFLDAVGAMGTRTRDKLDELLKYDATSSGLFNGNRTPLAISPAPAPELIAPGTVLANRYVIREVAGVGGMGQVYRAWDSNLKRDVAIKSLPAEFAAHPGRRAQLRQEADILATLNHPNIGVIHDFGEHEGSQFLVLEFVRGPTLADVLDDGPLPFDEALRMANEIALALEAAHQNNIVHRDLKPRNIKVTPSGRVIVLDFGLATALQDHSSPIGIDPAFNPAMTVIAGTPHYMSPEQANGEHADGRADIWAFGCVLFEMLGGRKAFKGESILETLDAVRKGDVDWSLLPSDSRPTLRRILRCCLEKDRAQRIQTSGELRIELAKLQQETQDAVRWYNRFKWTGDFRLPLGYSQTRLLFLLTQLPYVIGYLMVFYHWDHYDLDNALERNFMIPVDVSLPAIRLMSLIGFAIRVYFISLAGWKHHLAAHRFSQVFYAVLVLDGLWAATPLLISQWATKLVAWPGVILMVWLTFGQRSAMLSLERQSSVAGSTGAKR